jgi:hypothetical protein
MVRGRRAPDFRVRPRRFANQCPPSHRGAFDVSFEVQPTTVERRRVDKRFVCGN